VNISAHSSTPLSSITATTNKPNSNATAEKNAAEHTPEELKQIKQLKLRDQEVRSHEAAHLAAGQGITKGSASFSYQRGPDGVQYAIGGEVKIDASEVAGDPEATLAKAQQIQAAALAPAQPSSQDRAVAAKAAKMAIEAQAEINQQQNQKSGQESSPANYVSTDTNTNQLIDLTA
jgi:hypothetical protein